MCIRVGLSAEGCTKLENEIARLLEELHDPAAPVIDLMLIGVRKG